MLRAGIPISVVPLCLALLRCSDTATAHWPPPDSTAQPALPGPGSPLVPTSDPHVPRVPGGVVPDAPQGSPGIAPEEGAPVLLADAGVTGSDAGESEPAAPEPMEPAQPVGSD